MGVPQRTGGLSVWRTEEKYLLSYPQALRLKDKLRVLLAPDPYSPDGYRVRSLYLDSFHDNDYFEKDAGILHRKKLRLRIYDEAQQTVKLERKEKQGDYQHKLSLSISRADALRLCAGEFGVLLTHDDPAALRFYTELSLGLYRPVAVIEYDRFALTHELFSTRITFDSSVRASETDLRLFEPDLPWDYVLQQQVLLEVKYNGTLPKTISSVLKHENLNRVSLSKYAAGRRSLNEWLL